MSKKLARALIPAALTLCVACGAEPPQTAAPADVTALPVTLPEDTVVDSPDGPLHVRTVAAGLAVPWDFAFLPDGRVLFTERAGRIRVLVNDTVASEPWATLDVFADDPDFLPESGLMGIAADPAFAANGYIYVMATVRRPAGLLDRIARRIGRGSAPYENRIYRLTDRGGSGTDATAVLDGLPSNYYHAGGALRFGPDGMLYFSIGDNLASSRAQDPASRIGGIFRIARDGSVPGDNPLAGEPMYAHGLRNVQGIAWTADGTMLAIDHGPSALPHEDGRYGHDELNVIRAGGNYGWPAEAGSVDEPLHRPPVVDWMPGIAPAGLAVYSHTRVPEWQGALFVAGLRGQQLRRLQLAPDGTAVTDDVLLSGFGRLRAVTVAPDGSLYVTTSNRDGRGAPGPADDRILRILPLTDTSR